MKCLDDPVTKPINSFDFISVHYDGQIQTHNGAIGHYDLRNSNFVYSLATGTVIKSRFAVDVDLFVSRIVDDDMVMISKEFVDLLAISDRTDLRIINRKKICNDVYLKESLPISASYVDDCTLTDAMIVAYYHNLFSKRSRASSITYHDSVPFYPLRISRIPHYISTSKDLITKILLKSIWDKINER